MSEPLSPAAASGPISEPLTHKPPIQQGHPPKAHILIELDGRVSGEVLLQKSTLSIGRLSGSDIYIASKRISRQHAQIVADQGTWVIEDAGSVNGIMYQGSHVKRLGLSHGDRIHLAPDVSLLYEVIH